MPDLQFLRVSASPRLRGRFAVFRSPDAPITGSPDKAARRKFAAPQTVIVSDRRLPGVERSKSAKPTLSPPPFFDFCCKQNHLFHSTHAWPLGGPWVALGWPKGHPIPIPAGRGSQAFASTKYPAPSTSLWLIASCHLLAALFVKDHGPRTHFNLGPNI